MFSENDRISQRQMERQIVLVLLCPAFWQLAAYSASDGLPGMAGIFVGYGLLAVWCIYLVRLGGLYCRLESVIGKAGKLLLAVMYLCYLLFLGGTLLRRMAELAAAYLTAGVPQELCGLFLLAAAGFGVGSEVQKRGRLAEALYPWIVGGILILLLLTVPQMHFSSFEDAWKTAKSVEIVDNGILFGWNVWRTLENGTPIALLPFLLGHVQKEHRSVILPVTQSIWKTGLLVIAGSMALLGVFGRRGTAAAQDPLLLLMAGTSLPGGFLERFDILWMAFLLMGLLFTLGSLLFYVSLIGEKTGLWKPQNLYVRIGTVLFIWLLSCAESGWSVRYGYFPFFLAITVLLGFCQKHMKKLRLVCLALGSMIFLSSCGAVEPEKRLYPLAVAFDYVSEEATAPENSETGEETGTAVSESGGEKETAGGKWRVWYAPANLAVVTGQGKDEQEEGTDEDPASLFFEAETFEEIAQQYDSTEEYDLDTGHVQAIVFSDALLSDRGRMEELLKYLEQDRALGHSAYLFHAEKPEDIMEQNGKQVESVGEYLCGIYDNRVKRKEAVTLADLCYAWENERSILWIPKAP